MTFEHITVGGVVILAFLLILSNFYMVGRYATKREASLIDEKIKLLGERLGILADKATAIEGRVANCERDHSTPPTRHDLNNEVMKLVAEMRGLMAGVDGLQRQVGTNNDLLRTVIDAGVSSR